MNILLINANNPFRASGRVALDLFNGFNDKGHTVKLLTINYIGKNSDGIVSMESISQSYWNNSKLRNKLVYLGKKYNLTKEINIDSRYEFFELNEKRVFYNTRSILRKAGTKPDIIFVLFAKKIINTRNIYELFKRTTAQIFWLMYDMAPFTGGCHYSWDCKGYQNVCGNCPGLFSLNSSDITHVNILDKKYYLDKTNIQIIAGSEWQYRQAKASTLFRNKSVHKILLSVDPLIFKPIDKITERRKMSIPTNKKVVFFGSIAITTMRKGMHYLLESLKILKERISETELSNSILLLIAGSEIDGIVDELPFEYHYMGILDNTYGIALAYQVADVFICPSIEDSGPTMINQSIMCGTPVVSFEMGVAIDLVHSGETGYRAKLGDVNDLANGIGYVLNLKKNDYLKMSKNARDMGLRLCDPQKQIEQIIEIYNLNS